MIWGEVIQEIRRFHLNLIDQAPALLKPHSPELSLDTSNLTYPTPTDDMADWNPEPIHEKIAEWVEFHPVERALLEGPLLPIQKIRFADESEFLHFANAVIDLEKKWLVRASRAGEVPANWENELRNQLLRLQTRAGIRRLREV